MPKKKTEQQEALVNNTEDFVVITTNTSSPKKPEAEYSVDKEIDHILENAMKTYDMTKKMSSVVMGNTGSYNTPTPEELADLAVSPQDDLKKILRINSIIGKYVNLDDLLGTVVEAIRVNLNDDYRLAYKKIDGRNNTKKMERVKAVIESFNEDVGLRRLIREMIPRTYMEGTSIMYLRKSPEGWTIDLYPLGLAVITPYSVSGDPVILLDMNELKQRLNKMGYRTRNGKNMFFESMQKEVEENFPGEIFEAYTAKEPYAKLDIRYTGVMRVGNYSRRYGLSPLFKAIPCSLVLETFRESDIKNAKVRSKKVVYQLLDPILLGEKGNQNPLTQQAFAHSEIVAAFGSPNSVLYTAPGYVKEVGILEPKGDMIAKDVVIHYTQKEMASLGIGFLSSENNASVSSAKISLEQLMRNINSVSKSFEDVIEKFYRQVLIDENLDPSLAPTISIIDSEALDFELRVKIATLLYGTLNASLKTTLEMLGIPYDDEVNRRIAENREGVDKEFYARESLFTKSKDSKDAPDTGRPKGEENDKQVYDENYNEGRT